MKASRDVDAVIARKYEGGVPGQLEMPLDPAKEETQGDDAPARSTDAG